jgi:carbamoyl-phosphate synthase small subunit
MSKATILLEDGSLYFADANLNNKTVLGELVFNTSMTGYQEVLTDPSYSSQIVVMTYPLIGNYGVFDFCLESDKIQVAAFIVKENSEIYLDGQKSLSDFLAENNILCVSNIDTRKITKYIRQTGAKNCLITTEEFSSKHRKILQDYSFPKNVVATVSRSQIEKFSSEISKVADFALIDYGTKNNIIKNLTKNGVSVTVYPYDFDSEDVLSKNYDAVLLSNGPGNPKDIDIQNVKNLVGKIPLFGICLGHQILALALGCDTFKMKFGHRGGNHPVLNLQNGKVMITSQNHGYAVDEKSLNSKIEITYKNINDETIEGFCCKNLNIDCVQFHPEAAPGPDDADFIFKKWISSVRKETLYA